MATAITPSEFPQTTKFKSANGFLFTFPPFPQRPQGVNIVSFVDFSERGISLKPGPDDAEVDSLGIPTLMMPVKHSTDICKTATKRKREPKKKARDLLAQKARQLEWWEIWEETEMIRLTRSVDT